MRRLVVCCCLLAVSIHPLPLHDYYPANSTRSLPDYYPANSTQPQLSSNYSAAFFSSLEEVDVSNGSAFEIERVPVDTAADTLVVAGEDGGAGGAADDIIGAEHTRDVAMARGGRGGREGSRALELSEDDVEEFRKQLNISSEALDSIMEAETGRDESLTDIMFRPLPDYDLPRLAYLAALANSSLRRDYVELVEAPPPAAAAANLSRANLTGHDVADDIAPDTILSVFAGFTDLQTLVLACLGTLLPLLLGLLVFLLVRLAVRRCCPRCRRASSVDSDSDRSDDKPQPDDEYKPVYSPAHTPLSRGSSGGGGGGGGGGGKAAPANGSIITMTLKNNHLIVETEERNDIMKNGRETKMKYSPESDGIFVVEVQQSAPYRPCASPPAQRALVHRPPEPAPGALATGLSASALSVSSGAPSYAYSTFGGYEAGPRGYPLDAGYDVPALPRDYSREPLLRAPDPDRAVVTAAILKQDSLAGDLAGDLAGAGYCLEGSSDGPLLSDVQARELSLHQLHDRLQTMRRADTLPPAPIADIKELLAPASPRFRKLAETAATPDSPDLPDMPDEVAPPLITVTEDVGPALAVEADS